MAKPFKGVVRAGCLLLGLLALSCSRQTADKASVPPPWLRWTVGSAPETLQWWSCEDRRCRQWSGLIMEGLTRADFRDGLPTAVPALAAEWKNEGSYEFTFSLKKEIQWSDGKRLVAADFVAAWKHVLERCQTNSSAEVLFPILNAVAFCHGRTTFANVGISAPNSQTLKVRLAQRNPQFPFYMSHPVTWPVRFEKGKPTSAHTLGPFRMERPTATQFRFPVNSRYHGTMPQLGGIEARIVASAATRLQSFLEGETDLVDDIPSPLLGQVLGHAGIASVPTLDLQVLTISANRRPFHQPSVRKALTSAIDRQEIPSVLKWPHLPATSLVKLPTAVNSDPTFNVSTATSALAAMKLDLPLLRYFENGVARTFPRPVLARSASEESQEVAENLEAQWIKNLRLNVEVQTGNSATLTLRSFRPDPYHPVRRLDEFTSLVSDPSPRVRTKRFEDLLEEARRAKLSDSWKEHLERADEFLVGQEALVIPLYYRAKTILRRPSLQQLVHNPLEQWDFRQTTLK